MSRSNLENPCLLAPESSVIYFVHCQLPRQMSAVKIGRTRLARLDERITKLQLGNPRPLRLIAVCPGGQREEKELHRRFSANRVIGEWFQDTPQLGALTTELRGTYGVPPTKERKIRVQRASLPSYLDSEYWNPAGAAA